MMLSRRCSQRGNRDTANAEMMGVLQVNVQQVWLSFSSGVLAFVFIFGNNIRNIYESCLLLFVVHPFDVGDVMLLDRDQWCQVKPTNCLPLPEDVDKDALRCQG